MDRLLQFREYAPPSKISIPIAPGLPTSPPICNSTSPPEWSRIRGYQWNLHQYCFLRLPMNHRDHTVLDKGVLHRVLKIERRTREVHGERFPQPRQSCWWACTRLIQCPNGQFQQNPITPASHGPGFQIGYDSPRPHTKAAHATTQNTAAVQAHPA